MQLTEEYTVDIGSRFRWLHILIAALALVVIGRLFFLQIVAGDHYRRFSQEVSVRRVTIPATPGNIRGRHGRVLAGNTPTLDLVIIPQYVVDWPQVRAALTALLQKSPDEWDALWEKRRGKAAYHPIVVARDVTLDTVSQVRAHKTPWYFPEDPLDLRGVEVRPRMARRYDDGVLAAHILGYLKDSDAGEMEGVGGIEHYYNDRLRGVPGIQTHIVNAMGRIVDYPDVAARVTPVPPQDGEALQVTIDARLQIAARQAFGGRSGSVVALDPQTGEVLALYSSPSFDVAQLSSRDRSRVWQTLVADARKPLYNRAVQGAYPPGSTYKMVTAIAALAEGLVTPDEHVTCRGGIEIGGRRFGCWNKGGHGSVSLLRAISESCDVYFYTMGLRLGLDKIAHYAQLLGLGRPTGIDLPHERAGVIPTGDWKQMRFGQDPTAGDVASAAIGQGYNTLTPLQDALMVARLVNGGKIITPHVVRKSPLPPGEGQGEGAFNSTHLALIRKGMEGVVNAPSGTARHLAALKLKIAGKTGTAQTTGYESRVQKGDHAWFVGYAPYDNPKIVVAAIVEHGGHGGTAAAPIVGEVIRTYLTGESDVKKRSENVAAR
jgi:penicillin-binding protein 2